MVCQPVARPLATMSSNISCQASSGPSSQQLAVRSSPSPIWETPAQVMPSKVSSTRKSPCSARITTAMSMSTSPSTS